MKGNGCDEIRDDLVAFADGELAEPAAERVWHHVCNCMECAALVFSLRRSLAVAKLLWTDAAAVDANTPAVRAGRHVRIWPGALCAAAVLALAVGLWDLDLAGRREPTVPAAGRVAESAQSRVPRDHADVDALKVSIARAGMAAELLAATDYLAQAPGGREYACEQYRYIARTFAETAAAADSAVRLAALCEDHQ
jgi:hypothetical protein